MKKLLLFLLLFAAGLAQIGCSKDDKEQPDPKPEPVRLDRDTVTKYISRHSFYITDAWRFAGRDSVNMFKEDTLLKLFANAAFLNFFISKGEGPIMFHGGHATANTSMPGNALTFNLNIRIFLPTQMRTSWDEEKGTLRIETIGTTSYFPMIMPGKVGYLDTSNFDVKMTLDQAKVAVVKPSMRFIYDNDDPKLGKVTYKITLKPLYEYYRAPNQQGDANFVVFP
jgi:hypothetical protein